MQYNDLKFGVFLAPYPRSQENTDHIRQQDIELIEQLDGLGYNYAWISDQYLAHHYSPATADSFIAAVTERTSHITLGIEVTPGTGVSPGTGIHSPHDQVPRVLAERIMELAQLCRGRVEFVIRSGTPLLDTPKKTATQLSEVLQEAIQVLTLLKNGDPLTGKTAKSEPGAVCHDDNHPVVPLSIAAQVSPAGAGTAGRYGLGLLSLAATSSGGFNALPVTWEIYERKARENNRPIDRARWSLAGPVHIAETRKQAFDNVSYGLAKWIKHFHEAVDLPVIPRNHTADMAQMLIDSGLAVIGSPEDAIRQMRRLQEQSGGFGCFLQMVHQWANQQQTRKSYQLFAEQVAPVFQRHTDQSR